MRVVLLVALLGCAKPDDGAKVSVTELFTDKLVREVYPRWALANRAKTCPTIDELIKMLDDEGNSDPWGNPYRLACTEGASSPVLIRSAGPDGKYGTPDDVTSPRPHVP